MFLFVNTLREIKGEARKFYSGVKCDVMLGIDRFRV